MCAARSKVEVGPVEARFYDLLMDVISARRYGGLLRGVVDRMRLAHGHTVLDLGSGSGRNDLLIAERIGVDGRLLGLDVSTEMLRQSRQRLGRWPNAQFREERIEKPLPYENEFDRVFIAFVLHGFEDVQKREIVRNAYRALKPDGLFCIFDYNEFDLDTLWSPIRYVFTHAECELASEFLTLDLRRMLSDEGFTSFEEDLFARGHLRLLKAGK
jgi:ubiquinone/menaquinone biosynthesis C-methylase UbiE